MVLLLVLGSFHLHSDLQRDTLLWSGYLSAGTMRCCNVATRQEFTQNAKTALVRIR